jgi:hypothetical protein
MIFDALFFEVYSSACIFSPLVFIIWRSFFSVVIFFFGGGVGFEKENIAYSMMGNC